jgi:hypothetical protein
MDKTTEAFGDAKPKEGDYSMCLSCGAVSIFTKDLQLRKPTREEQFEIDTDPRLTEAQIVRAGMVGDKLKGRK